MATDSKRKKMLKKFGRIAVVLLCLLGFIYQTTEFLLLFSTYPTVVDIQEISPSYLKMPAFSICNPLGYNYTSICRDFNVSACLNPNLYRIIQTYICAQYTRFCINNSIPNDTMAIAFGRFMKRTPYITYNDHDKLRSPLEEYLTCTIEFAGLTYDCNLENVLGSFYTKEDLPQYCYSIYSLWGKPGAERHTIPRGAVMKLDFNLNASRKSSIDTNYNEWIPKSNIPLEDPYVQIAVHSPYFLPSPFMEGSIYQGGRAYQLRINMKETHLLPAPYQTNCTDYMTDWRRSKGYGPISQMGKIQECRVNIYVEKLGCVPVWVDYPHRYNICGNVDTSSVFTDRCNMLADYYNQACDSISYQTIKEDKEIAIIKLFVSKFAITQEDRTQKITAHDCSGRKMWSPECSRITVDILFDRFEITNLTYNAKYENLELFSVIGGYMGMWLGISLITLYDFIGILIAVAEDWRKKREKRRANPHRVIHSFSP